MTRKSLIIFPMFLLLMASCQQELDENTMQPQQEQVSVLERKSVNTSDNSLPGSLMLLLSESATDALQDGTAPAPLLLACEETGADLRRMFPYKGTAAERQHNLHRWHVLTFPEDLAVEDVAEKFAALSEVTAVEYNTELKRQEESEATEWKPGDNTVDPLLPYNDPQLIDQWHYINNVDLSVAPTSRVGADVNVKSAWELCSGDPAIIVAVCDEGVKYDHPDLAANMWVNLAEKNGVEGVDDDGNGYVDDIHGYNFMSTYNVDTGEGVLMPISWDRTGDSGHGTHVAGTVAAVNNNGIGVCGVAGGNGTAGSGVRIMSLQLFSGAASAGTISRALAYKYAADMGASILQCSFGQDAGNLSSDRDFENLYSAEYNALEYFMSNPAETNPVDGNFAIFASGNEGYHTSAYPAAYKKYISVSAFGPDYLPTSYTNYGPGTNICAPGGDYSINSTSSAPERAQILSTLPKELGKGVTYDDFLSLIYTSVNNIDYYIETCTKLNNGVQMDLTPFLHNMGTGAIDTWRLFMQIEGTPCLPVQKGADTKIALDQFFGPSAANLTFTKIEVSDEARTALGVVGEPYVKYGKLYIRCENEGSAKIAISAIAGGNEVAGTGTAAMGGTEFTREISVLSRAAGVSENGGWL